MTLSVTILGCSGTYAGPGGACSGYLVQSPSTNLWIDCGAGTFANLQRHIDLADLHGIVCSHSHPDHWLELPVAVNALRYGVGRPNAGIPLVWTAATAELFGAVSGRPPEPTFASRVVDETARVTIGDIDVSFSRTDHPVETLAVRADHDGHAIAYTADTGNDWSLSSLGSGIDIALVEATLDDPTPGIQHLTGSQAGSQAQQAGVATLVLTHLAPGSDPEARSAEAATAFDGPIAVAEIDRTYTT
ncbi:MAG: MBL fold metallo-hydrolase [Acidimicrobiales bacterium]|nr:MBL fold metallo-hydrolase [Acidimicrobiales bacterium]